jgi:hypothetical protein
MARRSDGNPARSTGCWIYSEISTVKIRRSVIMAGMGSTMTTRIPTTPGRIFKWILPRRFERLGNAGFSATLMVFSDLLMALLLPGYDIRQLAFHNGKSRDAFEFGRRLDFSRSLITF